MMPDLPPLPPGAKLDDAPSGLPTLPPGAKLDQSASQDQNGWQSHVERVKTHNGFDSVKRYDGGIWYGPKQGNTGDPGWFDQEGNRLPLNPEGDSPFLNKAASVAHTFARPFERTLEGTGQLFTKAFASPEANKNYQDTINGNEQDFKDSAYHGTGSGALELGGALMQPIPGLGGLGAAGKLSSKMLQGAFVGGGLSAAQPVYGDGSDFGSTKLKQAAIGTALGAAAPAVMDKVVTPVSSRIANALARLKAARSGALPAEAQAVQDLGDQFGVRTLAPDMTNSPGMNKTAVLMESVPGSGIVAQRQAQQAEAMSAAQKLLEKHGIEGDASTKIQQGLANKLAKGKGNSKAAYDLVAKLADGKGDVPLDQALAAVQKFKAQEASAVIPDKGLVGLLDKLENRLTGEPIGDHLDLTQTGNAPVIIKNGTPLFPKNALPDQFGLVDSTPVVIRNGVPTEEIKDIYGTVLKPGANPTPAFESGPTAYKIQDPLPPVIMHGPSAVVTHKADTSYTSIRGLRSDLGSMISDYYKGTNAATGSKGVEVLQGVKNALEEDLGAFTSKNGPELAQAAKAADGIYKNQVVPFKDQIIRKAVKGSEPDQIYKSFIQAGKGDRAQKFYNALDTDGQAAVRSQMVQNAFDEATQKEGTFSPAQFASSLEKVKDASGVFFKGEDKWELDGFTKLMRHIQRAGQIGENPTNGQRMVQTLIAGEGIGAGAAALTGHPAALIAPAGSMVLARSLNTMFKTARGKAFLLAASDLPAGSPAMDSLIEKRLPALIGSRQSASNVTPLQPLPKAAQNTDSE